MCFRKLLVLLLAVLMPTITSGATGLAMNDETASCSGGFTLDWMNLACDDDDGACTLGEELAVAGQITSSGVLPTTANVTIQLCAWSYLCYPWTFGYLDFCNIMTLTPTDGSSNATCPSEGTYEFHASLAAPGNQNWVMSWLEGYSLTAKVEILDLGGTAATTTCSATVTMVATTESSTTSDAVYEMGQAVAALGLVALFVRHRRSRRRTETVSSSLLEDEHSPEPSSGATMEMTTATSLPALV